MTGSVTPLVAGNWKMNGTLDKSSELEALARHLDAEGPVACEVMVCPPAPYIHPFRDILKANGILLGGQDCHPESRGAHTGDVSAEMLADVGCQAVIVGHSERRVDHQETDALVEAKARAAHHAGLTAIICVGETEAERDAGETLSVIERQVGDSVPEGSSAANTVIAYEPVWAIGTGRTPTNAEVGEVHDFIRGLLVDRFGDTGDSMRILYGGSVKPANAAELMGIANVNGALVGGASLKAEDFWGIIRVYKG